MKYFERVDISAIVALTAKTISGLSIIYNMFLLQNI